MVLLPGTAIVGATRRFSLRVRHPKHLPNFLPCCSAEGVRRAAALHQRLWQLHELQQHL